MDALVFGRLALEAFDVREEHVAQHVGGRRFRTRVGRGVCLGFHGGLVRIWTKSPGDSTHGRVALPEDPDVPVAMLLLDARARLEIDDPKL
jgi:hypothetical protein